jgi:hypothetical protein
MEVHMNVDEIREAMNFRVANAMIELNKPNPDMAMVRDRLCDAAQFTYFKEDGTRTDRIGG